MDDRDVFLKAIDVLQERGWHQGNYASQYEDYTAEDGPIPASDASVCLAGAVNLAAGRTVYDQFAHDLLAPLFDEPVGEWNDDPSRTVEDVVLALKRAAHGEAA